MAFRLKLRTVFVYGIAKSERDNIDPDELEFWQRVAASYLKVNEATLGMLIGQLELKDVDCHG